MSRTEKERSDSQGRRVDKSQRQMPEKTGDQKGTVRKIYEKVRKVPKGEAAIDATKTLGAVIPPVSVGLESVTKLFDQSEAKGIKTIGDSQLEAAQKALADAQKDPEGDHAKSAEQSLRSAYEVLQKEIESREAKVLSPILPTGETRAAYQRKAEAALLIAAINQGSPAAETWANHARDDFEQYTQLTEQAADRGIRRGKSEELRHTLEKEKKNFTQLYDILVPPEEFEFE